MATNQSNKHFEDTYECLHCGDTRTIREDRDEGLVLASECPNCETENAALKRVDPDDRGETPIPAFPPEVQPEFVGAYSAVDEEEECVNWMGETMDELEPCGDAATHTVVMFDGALHKMPMCDACGEPEDVIVENREWSA